MGVRKEVFAVFLVLLATPFFCFAASSTTLPPSNLEQAFYQDYSATYSTVYKKGLSIKLVGTQTLTQTSPNSWQFDFSVNTMLASLSESSTFTLDKQTIRPLRYAYESSIFSKKKAVDIHFNWKSMNAVSEVNGESLSMAITPLTVDRLTLQLQLRHDLRNGKQSVSYDIADGGKLKEYTFAQQGKEFIDTKLGKLEVIKVSRTDNLTDTKHTFFWFAPAYDYLLVKMEHLEKGDAYILDIDKVTSLYP